MNVIDFHVTKILSEKYGKVYELYFPALKLVANTMMWPIPVFSR